MKDHFIPCLLLSRFSVSGETGRKALVYQLRTTGPHPIRPVPAEDLAYAGNFYQHDEFPSLDDAGLGRLEREAATLINELAEGLDPQSRAREIAMLVHIQSFRTQAFRTGVRSRLGGLLDAFLSKLPTEGQKLMQEMAMTELLDPSGQVTRMLERAGIPPLSEADALKLIQSAVNPESLTRTTQEVRDAIIDGNLLSNSIHTGQVKGLHSVINLPKHDSDHTLANARWVRLEAPVDQPLVLGDACVVACDEKGNVGWPFKFGSKWKEMYLPVGRHLAVVALAPDGPHAPTLDADSLNRSSATLASKFIYAARCTAYEIEKATLIGTVDPLLDHGTDSIVDDFLRPGMDPDNG